MTHINTDELGNTRTNSSPPNIKNTNLRSRKFAFTLFNYKKSDIDTLTQSFCQKYIFGEEICPSTGKEHLQGYLEFENARSFTSIKKKFPQIHIEKANGSIEENYKYCSKDNKFYTNIKLPYKEMPTIITDLYDWQLKIVNIIKNEKPNDRTIHWFYDEIGNKGKSALCKYLLYHELAMYIKSGSASDIKNVLLESKNCRDIVIDISRAKENYVSYTLLEELKDGYIFSTKYKGGAMLISTPHIFVFANFMPEKNKLSEDRLIIHEL